MKKNGNLSMIITIVAAALAVVAIVLLLIFMNKDGEEPSEPVIPGFQVTEEFGNECIAAAQKLVGDNYEIIRLYVTEGLPLKKVYGNVPEPLDGYYQTDSTKYTEFAQIETLVKSVYTPDEAAKILGDLEVNAVDGSAKPMEVYKSCTAYGETFLGVNEQFIVDYDYKADWSSCFVEVKPLSETECNVTVYLDGVTSDTAAEHADSVRSLLMLKTENGWRLAKFLK